MSPDHWSKLTWDTVSAGGYDLFDPIGYLDRKRDRAYKQRVIVTPAKQRVIVTPATVSAPLRINYRSLPARPKRKMMSVVRAYEVDVWDRGLGSAIKISCPSYLGPN